MRKHDIVRLLPVLLFVGLQSCGEGTINLDKTVYEPKIVIEGFLRPGEPVRDIRITRNFPLQAKVDVQSLPIADAVAILTDLETEKRYQLTYDPDAHSYYYRRRDLTIGYNQSYRLAVIAQVDGQSLSASATTTTPDSGFGIVEDLSNLGPLPYRARDVRGFLDLFFITFQRSPNVKFYTVSIVALDADSSTFIYSPVNPFTKADTADVVEHLDEFRHGLTWLQDTPLQPGLSGVVIDWFNIFFYGRYRAIVYAGDQNYRDFFLTHNQVQDIDGNFRQPKFHIEGDGIGVFGSVIADTVYFEVLRP